MQISIKTEADVNSFINIFNTKQCIMDKSSFTSILQHRVANILLPCTALLQRVSTKYLFASLLFQCFIIYVFLLLYCYLLNNSNSYIDGKYYMSMSFCHKPLVSCLFAMTYIERR